MTDSTPGDVPPPPTPPQLPPTPPLTRSTTDRYVAGVCGGLGAHLGVAPIVLRLGFAGLTLAGGVGFLLYIAAWLLIPQQGHSRSPAWDALSSMSQHSTRTLVAGGFVIVAIVLVSDSLPIRHQGILWGTVLAAAGIFLLVQERRQPLSSFTATTTTATPPTQYAAATFSTTAATTPAIPSWGPVRAPRPRSILGLVTVAAALLALGVTALLESAGIISVTVATYAAIALIVVGAGLVAGTWFGRSRGLIALGVLLIPVAGMATLVDQPLAGGAGTVIFAPQRLADLRSQYHLAAGQLTIDLSQIPLSASPTVSVTVATGRLTVVLPQQSNFYVDAHAGAGHINLEGTITDGINVDAPLSQSPSPAGGTVHLALSVGLGEIDLVTSSGTPVQGR